MKPRSKSYDNSIIEVLQQRGRYYNQTSEWYDQGSPFNFSRGVRSGYLQGFDIDHYHKLKREGALLPSTPFTQVDIVGSSSGTYYVKDANHESKYFSDHVHITGLQYWPTETDCLYYLPAYDSSELVQAAAAKIYSSGWDALTFASEFHKTARMFVDLRKKIGRIVTDKRFRKEMFDMFLRDKKQAKLWLEYRYGWRTLLYDIKDFSKALNNLGNQRKRFSDRAGYSISGSTTVDLTNNVTSSQTGEKVVQVDSWEASLRGTVVADIEPPSFQFNPVVTGWELVTFSFVVDWFITVGQTLEALSFLMIATNYSAAAGVSMKLTRDKTFVPGNPVAGILVSTLTGTSRATCTLVKRTPTSISKVPKVRLNLDLRKLLDVASLVRVRL